MNFNHQLNGQILELSLTGDLIGESSGLDIIELVNNYIQDEIKLCVIDISGLRYINSSGIGVLITVLTKFRNKGGEVCLLNPSENVRKLLIITKLNAIFNIAQEKTEAVEILQNSI